MRFLRSAVAVVLVGLFVAPSASAGSPPLTGTVVRDNTGWTCSTHVDLELVRITAPPGDGLRLGSGCTGVIRQIVVTGVRNGDGVKVQNASLDAARDLVIGSASRVSRVACSGPSTDGTHQDGIQVMGGSNITFRNLAVDCYGGGGGNLFVSRGGGGATTPANIRCERCAFGPRFGPNGGASLTLGSYVGTAVVDSLVCRQVNGRTNPIVGTANLAGTMIVSAGDARCANIDTLAGWVAGGTAPPPPPPPPPPPDPVVCDQACVDGFMAEIAGLRAELDEAGANEGLLLAEIARLKGVLSQIAELVSGSA